MIKSKNPTDIKINESCIVLDIRDHGEVMQSGKVKEALHIPMHQIQQKLNELDKSKTIYVYCASGGRANSVCEYLTNQGYDCYNTGGFIHWKNANHSV